MLISIEKPFVMHKRCQSHVCQVHTVHTTVCTGISYILTSWESKVTRSPSLAIPSSFSSLRCGHSAKQKARAIRSISRLCSAESLAPLLGRSPLCRKNTCIQHIHININKGREPFQIFLVFQTDHLYFCPADDLPIFFVFKFLEHLCTANGLHGFPINGTYNSVEHKRMQIIYRQCCKKYWKCLPEQK